MLEFAGKPQREPETDRPRKTGRKITDNDPLKQHLVELFKAVADICDGPGDPGEDMELLQGAYSGVMATDEGMQLYTDLMTANSLAHFGSENDDV